MLKQKIYWEKNIIKLQYDYDQIFFKAKIKKKEKQKKEKNIIMNAMEYVV